MRDSPKSQRSRWLWYWLLLIPIASLAFPALYTNGPTLFGMPFFYWYQIAWSIVTGAVIGVVYRATR